VYVLISEIWHLEVENCKGKNKRFFQNLIIRPVRLMLTASAVPYRRGKGGIVSFADVTALRGYFA